jgi:hypothetical protein
MIKHFSITRRQLVYIVLIAVIAVAVAPTFAQSSTPTLTFNIDPFFDAMNDYLPMFMGIFAIAAAIAGAAALVRMVLGAIVEAFSGRFG